VQVNHVNFFDSALFDFSAFASIASLDKYLPVAHLDFYTTSLQPSSTTSGLEWDNTNGIYHIILQQNMMVTTTDVSLLSLDASLALVGGYAGTIWLIIGCFCGGFADFAYQNSLVREFVKKRSHNNQVVEGEEGANDLENIVDSTKSVHFSYCSYLIA
jgi:hypothetical protein